MSSIILKLFLSSVDYYKCLGENTQWCRSIDSLGHLALINRTSTDPDLGLENHTERLASNMEGMNRKIRVGVLWNLFSLFITNGASTLFMLFLARLLAPEAFGLVAMVAVVFQLAAAFINSGLGVALIRSKTVSAADYNTVFYTNLLLSAVAYAALYIGAPFLAGFFSQPELITLIEVMGLVVFVNAAKLVQIAVLSRKMDFKSQMKANALGVVVSGCLAVTAAKYGWGVWSLAVQMLGSAIVSTIVLWLVSTWRPALQFSTESFSRLFIFGRNLLAEGLLSALFQNSYVLVIGRFFNAEVTGLYFLSKKVSELISKQLTEAVQKSTFPALSTLQDNNEDLRNKYRQILQLMMFIIAPIMGLMAALAPALFGLLLGDRWSEAVPYFQLLCVVGVLYPLHALNINLLNVKGKSEIVLKIGLIKRTVGLTLLFFAIPFGVLGIVISQVIGSLLALIPNTYYSNHLINYSFLSQAKDSLKPIFSAFLASVASWIFSQKTSLAPLELIIVSVALGITVYLLVSFISRAEGAILLIKALKRWF